MTAPNSWEHYFAAQMAAYAGFYGFTMPDGDQMRKVRMTHMQFGESDRILSNAPLEDWELTPGRRLRVFASMINARTVASPEDGKLIIGAFASWVESPFDKQPLSDNQNQTYCELLAHVEAEHWDVFSRLRLKNFVSATTPPSIESIQESPGSRNPELAFCLQDLGDEINEDIRDACESLRNPDFYYPGIDEGIDPVSDDHIDLVIWALQRELNRELRQHPTQVHYLPAPPLKDLPQRIKRALVERRRYRYAQFGLGRENWETGWFSLWDVPVDPDWVPRRQLRLALANAT